MGKEKMEVGQISKPRFEFRTFGQEKGRNCLWWRIKNGYENRRCDETGT